MKPCIVAIGGAHIDRRGQIGGQFVPRASNPGTMREDIGGAAFNALRSAVRRGAQGVLFSIRGGDAAGEAVGRAVVQAGIVDRSAVFLDRGTASYTALLDCNGELIAALADMGIYDLAFPKQVRRAGLREAIAAADAMLADTNLPEVALERLAQSTGGKPLFAIAISPAKVMRLSGLLGHVSCLFMNRREAATLAGAASDATVDRLVEWLRKAGLKRAVITAGDGPITAFDESGSFSLVPPPPRSIADVTGAGDALAGAAIVALIEGRSLASALREGAAAAMLAVECRRSVPEMSQTEFAGALALVPAAEEMQ
jgi:sugar/nucleoside kinase (ribokinase family)